MSARGYLMLSANTLSNQGCLSTENLPKMSLEDYVAIPF